MVDLEDWMRSLNPQRRFHVLDLFGYSQKVASTSTRAGYRALSYDVKLDKSHDICSQLGFRALLRMAMQLHGKKSIKIYKNLI